MKKNLLKNYYTLLLALLLYSSASYSQTIAALTVKKNYADTIAKPSSIPNPTPETAWQPVRRLWGYAFGDFYYDSHADAGGRGAETNYAGVPTYRNAFQFRRIYLGYDYDIDQRFTAEMLLSSEPSANTNVSGTTSISAGDNLADNKMSFFIKLFDLRWKNVWKGSDLVIGEGLTPVTAMLTEKVWGYRSIEKTIADFHRSNLFDLGVSLQGTFDPAAKNYGYDVMVANNTQSNLLSAANANTGFFKAFYGDVYAKFLNQSLIFDLYADYAQTASSTALLGSQSRNMIKGFVAYTTPKITFGVEAYTQNIKNGLTNAVSKTGVDATVRAISVYSRGALYKDKVGFFARYDSYNPDNDFNALNTYTVNTNLATYNPFYREHFITAGLDFTFSKTVHFMPNVWYIKYIDQRDPASTTYVPDDHTLVYRATFFFSFGK